MQTWEWVVAEISEPAMLLQGARIIVQNSAADRLCSSLFCASEIFASEALRAFKHPFPEMAGASNAWQKTVWISDKHSFRVRRRRVSVESNLLLLLVEPLSASVAMGELGRDLCALMPSACIADSVSLRPYRDAERLQRKRTESIARVGSYRLQVGTGQFYATGFLQKRLRRAGVNSPFTFERLLSVFDDNEARKIRETHESLLRGAAAASTEVVLADGAGDPMNLELRCECDRDEEGVPVCIYGAFIDVTHRVRGEEEVRFLAYHDALTELPNRAMFMKHSEQLLQEAKHGGESFALHLIDLDGFKALNDNYGHLAGDRTLQIVAERLVACIRCSDMSFRLGGDEFAILLRGVHSVASIERLGERLAKSLSEPFMLGAVEVSVGASLGGALYEEGEEIQHMMLRADEMLYTVKRSGKGSFKLAA